MDFWLAGLEIWLSYITGIHEKGQKNPYGRETSRHTATGGNLSLLTVKKHVTVRRNQFLPELEVNSSTENFSPLLFFLVEHILADIHQLEQRD